MPDYPAPLGALIQKLSTAIHDLTAQLEAGSIPVSDWQTGMQALLARYHTAAYMVGLDSTALSKNALEAIAAQVEAQMGYLNNFALVISSVGEFQAAFYSRADMYSGSITTEYWEAKSGWLPLPAMPGQGTQCGGRCKCAWRIETLDEKAGDFDCYWELGVADHCGTCVERAAQWNPVQIRDGVLMP
jgi:hypothetical protein